MAKYCPNCGYQMQDEHLVCANCGMRYQTNNQNFQQNYVTYPAPPNYQAVVKEQGPEYGWVILGFMIPIVGWILCGVFSASKPLTSKYCGISGTIGFFVFFILALFTMS